MRSGLFDRRRRRRKGGRRVDTRVGNEGASHASAATPHSALATYDFTLPQFSDKSIHLLIKIWRGALAIRRRPEGEAAAIAGRRRRPYRLNSCTRLGPHDEQVAKSQGSVARRTPIKMGDFDSGSSSNRFTLKRHLFVGRTVVWVAGCEVGMPRVSRQ